MIKCLDGTAASAAVKLSVMPVAAEPGTIQAEAEKNEPRVFSKSTAINETPTE